MRDSSGHSMDRTCRSPVPGGGPVPPTTCKTKKRDEPIFAAGSSTNARRKTALACEECRDRKRRCDGERPRCGGCSKRGPQQECVYAQNTWKLGRSSRRFENSNPQNFPLGNVQGAEGAAPFLQFDGVETGSLPRVDQSSTNKRRRMVALESGPNENSRSNQESDQDFRVSRPSLNTNLENQIGTVYSRGEYIEVSSVPCTPPATMDGSEIRASQKHSVDAMGAVSGSAGRTLGSAFFGPTSIVNFMSQVQRTIRNSKFIPAVELAGGYSSARAHSSTNRREEMNYSVSWSEGTMNMNYDYTDYLVPPRSEADVFVDSYFTNVHVLHPFIHRATFMEQYLKLWAAKDPNIDPIQKASDETFGNEIQRQIFHVMLNLIFALGCRSEPSLSAHERISKSERFFMRTQHPRIFELLNHVSLEIVQAMLLMGRYLQATERSAKCWNIVGLAIRVAQGIGLHLDVAKNANYSQFQVEIRKRIWGSCLILDRDLSMTYGRPCMVHHLMNRNTPIPSIIDDDLLTSSTNSHVSQPEAKPSLMAFFVHSIRLSEILGEVLGNQYYRDEVQLGGLHTKGETSPADGTVSSDYQAVLLLDASLTKWQRSLPSFLNDSNAENDLEVDGDTVRNEMFGHDPSLKSLFDLQALVLYVHRNHIRIVLLRPSLISLFDKEHGSSDKSTDNTVLNTIFQQTMMINVSNICVSTAQRQVDVLTNTNGKISDPTHAWWYKVYYIYTSAIVILIGRLCPSIEGIGGQSSLAISWERCLSGLKSYFDFSQAAQKGYKALEMIDERIFRPHASDSSYSQVNPSDDSSPDQISTQIRTYSAQKNSESAPELHSAGPRNSGPDNFYLPISPGTTHLDEVGLSVDSVLNSSSDNPLDDAEIDMNWSRNDLQLDWLESMPFADDFGGGGL